MQPLDEHKGVGGEVDEGAFEWLTGCILDAIAKGGTVEPTALLFLLRRYAAIEGEDLGDALGHALASAMGESRADTTDNRARWLMLFTETGAISGDERLRTTAADLVAGLRLEWTTLGEVDRVAHVLDACLTSAEMVAPHELVPAAIDQLERIVAAAYRPGAGIGHVIEEPSRQRGRLSDHVRTASALLTGYARSGRLPYSMLAEELMQFVRRTLWDELEGGFFEGPLPESTTERLKPFALNCEAVRVLCRLDALHHDDEYRKVAVVATGTDYANDAARTLASQTPNLRARGLGAAIYGIALGELVSLR